MQKFQYLVENVVLNVDAVTAFAERVARSVRAPEAKAWFAKKLRAFILNTDDVLTVVPPQNVDRSAPAYVHQAIEKGEAVFQFQPSASFNDRVSHIRDFFDSLYDASNAPDNAENSVAVEYKREAQKVLSKLQKMNFQQVEGAHEQWMARAGRISSNMSKEGCETIMTFGNGFYWVRYTDANTMRRDGEDLQNCLRTGNYASAVRDGSQAVYGLRRANDEAVIGIRVSLTSDQPRLQECKGKNNKPANPQYVPYIIEFLNEIKAGVDYNHDLEAAGIYVNDGRFGPFEDVADLVHDRDGVKIFSATDEDETNYLVKTSRAQFWIEALDDRIINITDHEGVDARVIIAGLNALDLRLSSTVTSMLAEVGIFPSENGFGTVDEVGTTVWTGIDPETEKAISTIKDGAGYLFVYRGNGKMIRFGVEGGLITLVPQSVDDDFAVYSLPAVMAAKVRYAPMHEEDLLWPLGIIGTKANGYVPMRDVGSKALTLRGGKELYQITERLYTSAKVYYLDDNGYHVFTVVQKQMDVPEGFVANYGKYLTAEIMQFIARVHTVNHYSGGLGFVAGLFKVDGEYIAGLDDFISIVHKWPNAKYDGDGIGKEIISNIRYGFASKRDEAGVLMPQIQKKIFNALKPTKDELIHIVEQHKTPVHGHAVKTIKIGIANTLTRIVDHLPAMQSQIEAIRNANTKALEIFLKKQGMAYITLWSSGIYNSNSPWERMIERYNEETRRALLRKGEERLSKEPSEDISNDTFATLNQHRRATTRRG